MFDILGEHQASIFLDVSSLDPSPKVISDLMNRFRDKGLLPSTFEQFGQNIPPATRLKLESKDKEWSVIIPTHRVDIQKKPVRDFGNNIGSTTDFVSEVGDLLSRVLDYVNKPSHRLSLVMSGLLREMTEEELNSAYRAIFLPLQFYDSNPPFEWNSRHVSRVEVSFNGLDEVLNAILSIDRVSGKIGHLPFDRIRVSFDINTIADNKNARFTSSSLDGFFREALKIQNELISHIEGVINGSARLQ